MYVCITMTKIYVQNFWEGTQEELHKKLLFLKMCGRNRYFL